MDNLLRHGFLIVRERPVPEQNGRMVELVHEKTGARVAWLDTPISNKHCTIAFRTPPEDSTGVFHVIEHCVFGGSEKYPVKDIISVLQNGTLYTSLGAYTGRDHTFYPFGSCNKKGYLSLLSVYLDMLFRPLFITNPYSFEQEGWRLEVDGTPQFNGVVYNEMKGSRSSMHQRVAIALSEVLFSDTCYSNHSGGDPQIIPELTYEQLVETYRKYYHPSNAYVYLDGSIPLDETLALLDDYFSQYNKQNEIISIPCQEVVTGSKSIRYDTNQSDAKPIYALAKQLATWDDRTTQAAFQILKATLAASNDDPIKKAVLDTGLTQSFDVALNTGVAQPYVSIFLDQIEEHDIQTVMNCLRDSVASVLASGIDRDVLYAAINQYAFNGREVGRKPFEDRAKACMQSWIYGGDPLLYIVDDAVVKELRKMVDGGSYERLLERIALPEGWVSVTALPSLEQGAYERKLDEDCAKARWEAFTEEEQRNHLKHQADFVDWQQTPNTPAQLSTIPKLTIEDCGEMSVRPITDVTEKDGVTVLRHSIPSNGIAYLRFYFSLSDLSLDELSAVTLQTFLLKQLPTCHYSTLDLQNTLMAETGGISIRVTPLQWKNRIECSMPFLEVTLSVLDENVDKGLELVTEILTNTIFEDRETIRKIVDSVASNSVNALAANGMYYAQYAADSHFSATSAINEATGGVSSVKWVKDLSENFDARIGSLLMFCKRIQKDTLCQKRLTISVSSQKDIDVGAFIHSLPVGSSIPKEAPYVTPLPQKCCLIIPGQTSYVSKSYRCHNLQQSNKYSSDVVNQLLFDYLHESIRVRHGAYGAFPYISTQGLISMVSFRDPSPNKSIEAFDQAANYIENLDIDITPHIISCLDTFEIMRSPDQQASRLSRDWLCGYTEEERIQEYDAIRSTTIEQVRSWAKELREFAEQGAVFAIGHADAIGKCEGLESLEL